MSLTDYPYIQHLALIQLNYLSIYSKQGRKSLFSLNFKNGQPTNWLKVSNEALNNIKCFMDIFNFDDMLHGSGKLHIPSGVFEKTNKFSNFGLKQRANVMSPIQSPVTSPIRQANKSSFDGANNYPKSPQHHHQTSGSENDAKSKFLNSFVCKEIIENLKRKKIFHLIYNENLNYKTEQLFIDSFLIINTLKALSNLVIASYNEDEYGIVQQTLPEILTSLVNLQKMLEKFITSNSNTSISFKVLQKPHPGHIELLMQKLSFILNESIFKITQTFGTTLKSLGLNEEVCKRLEKYYLIN
jgi:nucleoporin NDC1